jgi:hypothetical protein
MPLRPIPGPKKCRKVNLAHETNDMKKTDSGCLAILCLLY